MAAASYDSALKHVLIYEGGYVNHPKDPGGPTMKGVTQRVYDGFRDRSGLSHQPVRKIADAELASIYRHQYWDAIRADDLPAGVDFVVFDGAVNSGVSRSAKWLQRALGVKADGHLGEATIAAARNHSDHDALIAEICRIRLAFLKALTTWSTFGKGWKTRVDSVKDIGCGMTDSDHVATPIEDTPAATDDTNAKAMPTDDGQASGISEGSKAGVALAGGGVLWKVWEAVTGAPESILNALVSATSKPEFWIFATAGVVAVFIWQRRRQMKLTE